MRTLLVIVGLLLGAVMLTAPEPAEARRCWCRGGYIHTARTCWEACGRGNGLSVRRDEKKAQRAHDARSDAQARNARKARAAAGSGGMIPRRSYRRTRDVPQQEGLTNLDEKPVSSSLEGVFCSEGEVLFPKLPTTEMILFCRRQAGK
ncbi:MAG: hypothetical protein OEP95_06950 [Myxococcales bacterium]|nr:hypothetical protein [Myxococcales bacterium]